jgi:3-hydroxyisobutyrate dehydrogenase
MTTIAFIGLGNMGMPMSINLLKAGHDIRAFDPVPAAMEQAAAEGMTACASSVEAVGDADVIITMLPNGAIVLKVFEEVVPAAAKGAVIIDCSTIDMPSSRKAHEIAAEAGLLPLDAPVSGGVGGAVAGTLTFMVGGTTDAFERPGRFSISWAAASFIAARVVPARPQRCATTCCWAFR